MGLAIRCRNVRACHRRREFERYFRTSDFPRIQTVAVTARILLVGDARDVCKIGAPHETADISVWRAGWTGLAENAMSVYAPQNFSEKQRRCLPRRPAGRGSEGPGYRKIETDSANLVGAVRQCQLPIGSSIE